MALTVLTNTYSLNSQRALNTNQSSMAKTLARLSSGMRINKAGDDAAGLAISNGLMSQISGLNRAVQNADDGLSLLGTAEAAMSKQVNILQRIRVLAVQSSNDTNNTANRTVLNEEVIQLKGELDRIAKTTAFNGVSLLDGSFTDKSIQAGAFTGVDDKIQISITSARASALGSAYKFAGTTTVATTNWSAGQVSITANGTTTNIDAPSVGDGVSTAGATTSAMAKAIAINAKSFATGVSATASTTMTGANQTAGAIADGELKINGINIGAVTIAAVASTTLVDAINTKTAQTGVTATLDTSDGGKVVLTAADGRNIDITAAAGASEGGLSTGTNYGKLSFRGTSAFTITDSASKLGLGATSAAGVQDTTENVFTLDISTRAGADVAVSIVDVAISNLNSKAAAIGAQSNRLEAAMENMRAVSENFSASNSRILDADFAAETASMTKTQILVQAGIAMLAQANSMPQMALSLLK